MLRGVGQRPVLAVLVGAVAIAFSGILFRLAHVSPSTGAFYRCVWAPPPPALLSVREDRRFGPRPARARGLAWVAGGFFAADLVLWHHAIEQVGAGLATVLGNTQVVLVGPLDLPPSWAARGWLVALALSSKVLGGVLIAVSFPRLPAVITSILL